LDAKVAASQRRSVAAKATTLGPSGRKSVAEPAVTPEEPPRAEKTEAGNDPSTPTIRWCHQQHGARRVDSHGRGLFLPESAVAPPYERSKHENENKTSEAA
jgi:hypothetical protein